jgi:cytochrome c-type biogenesis protein CcmH/NrfG
LGNATQSTTNATWTSAQAYILAVICLVVGVGAGYIVRGSAAPIDATAAVPQQQQVQAAGMTGGGQEPSPEQLKRMADKQAEPLLAALKTNPKDADVLAQLGNIYYDTQVLDRAVEYYAKALEIDPKNVNVRTDMGTAYFRLGDSDRAIKEFETALKTDPRHGQTLFNLGIVKWQGKMDVPGAVAVWENLLKTVPDYPERDKVQQYIAQAKKHSTITPGTKTDKPASL